MDNRRDYSPATVNTVQFAPWVLGVDGRMSRTWEVRLAATPERDVRSWRLNEPGLEVRVAQSSAEDPRVLAVTTVSLGDHLSDEIFYFATYRLFAAIDRELAPISAINGSPRNVWYPFRHST